jgi:hypothetical protein
VHACACLPSSLLHAGPQVPRSRVGLECDFLCRTRPSLARRVSVRRASTSDFLKTCETQRHPDSRLPAFASAGFLFVHVEFPVGKKVESRELTELRTTHRNSGGPYLPTNGFCSTLYSPFSTLYSPKANWLRVKRSSSRLPTPYSLLPSFKAQSYTSMISSAMRSWRNRSAKRRRPSAPQRARRSASSASRIKACSRPPID